ncbi:MAG TPA: hypothetical protein PKN33_20220 [Phycisphaerae bacterium]|nr:hypothetical protein [Phycisphaerae bacterium]
MVADTAIQFDEARIRTNVPEALRERPQWVCWGFVKRGDKLTKCPLNPMKGSKASSTDPSTWGTFDTAIAGSRKYGNGVGFVFTAEDPIAGVDLDDCIDPQTGDIKAWARVILNALGSYSETSPSGTGVKVFLQATKNGGRCKTGYKDGAIEMYDSGRFFTVTGARWGEYSTDVEERQEQFDALYAKVFAKPEKMPPASSETTSPATPTLTDDEIIRLACSSRKSGTKFSALWDGRWEEYFNSASEADSSVIFTLAYYTKDSSQLDRLFRCSGLMRPKWDERHGEQSYGELTIGNALQHVTKQYRPRNASASSKRLTPQTPANTGRPQIQFNERQLRDVRDDAVEAIIAANDPPKLFRRGSGIARIGRTRDTGVETPFIQQLEVDGLRGELTNVADWFQLKHLKHSDVLQPDLPPTSVAKDILALPKIDLPPLVAIVTCPTFAADGHLIIEPGYDESSGLWHHETLTDFPPVPSTPSQADIDCARDLLLDLLADFPFVDEASCAHAFALILLPFVRAMIEGPTPCHGVDAPTPGTGKDLLVKVATMPALGYEVGATTAARDPDEWRKKITSALLSGTSVVVWGNIARRLDSEHLAAVLTDTVWRDRQLGKTHELTLPNRTIWAATGNNLAFSKEIARRVIWIRLDAKVEAPESRTGFRHANLIQYARDHRTQLVHAALTLVQAWISAGRPECTQTMGSYESYTKVMGGMLAVAGISGFLSNADGLRQRGDTETSEWRAFVLAWWEQRGDAWVGVNDLMGMLWNDAGERTDLLLNVVTSGKERGAPTQLGRRLSSKRDTIIAGFCITASHEKDRCGRLVYRLLQNSVQTSASETESLQEVCTQVCTSNSHQNNDLEGSADLRILNSDLNAYARARTRTRAHTHKVGNGKKSAKVCTSAQHSTPQQVTRAYLPADFVQTSLDHLPMSADLDSKPSIRWFTGNDAAVSQNVRELARERDGWTPASWRNRLLQLADSCAGNNPERADELRQAAALMCSDEGRIA